MPATYTMSATLTNLTIPQINPWKAWLVCFAAALFFFYEFIQMNMFSSIDPELMRAFSINATQLGTLSSCYFYANVLFLFPAGIILDRYSTRKVIQIAMLTCILGTFCFAKATTLWSAEIYRFLTGIGSAFCFLSCIRLASRWFPSHRMALVTGLVVTIAMIGGMVAQIPLTLLTTTVGWRQALLWDTALGVIIWFIISMGVQDSPLTAVQAKETHNLLPPSIGLWQGLRQAWLRLQNWLGGIYTCLMNLPIILLGGLWGSLYLTQVQGLTRTQASLAITLIFIGTVLGSPLVGWLSDRICRRRLPMLWGALLSLGIMAVIIFNTQLSLTSTMLLFFSLGLFSSTQIISYPTIAESNSPALTATSVSVISLCTQSAGVIFQPLFGWLMDLHWQGQIVNNIHIYTAADYHRALLILLGGFIVAFFAAVLLRETFCRAQV